MIVNRILMITGLVVAAITRAIAQNQSTELKSRIEQLRLLSSQATDQARECDQNAANEDRLAQTGPSWARLVHQLAAVKFRNSASTNRESARQYLTQAQELQRQAESHPSRAVTPGATIIPASVTTVTRDGSVREDYLTVVDDALRVENMIESYLNRSGIKASTVTGNNGAIHFVLVGFAGANGLPNLQYKIMALPPSASGGGEPRSQLIGITLETNAKAATTGEPLYTALAEANKIGNCAWFVEAGEVKCRSWIYIPSTAYPVPTELVRAKLRMTNSEWLRFSPQIVTVSK